MSDNLVSVIINCYNGEKYLEECIESVLNQTYKNWEIIFWDNQSTDNSKKIIEKFIDERIKYFYAPTHEILYSARNYALKRANGKYISFLDTDDCWFPNKLELQMSLFENEDIGIVCSNYFILNEKKEIYFLQYKFSRSTFFNANLLLKNYRVGLLTLVIRRSVLNKIPKPYFNNKYNIIGDFDLVLNLSRITKIYYLNKPLAKYRIHSKSISTQQKKLICEELIDWQHNNSDFYIFSNFKIFKSSIIYLSFKNNFLNGVKNDINYIDYHKMTTKHKFLLFIFQITPNLLLRKFFNTI
jgi:glycosyltransferase involved in cell wall biosynthesis